MVLGQGVSSLTLEAEALGIALDFGGLHLEAEGFFSAWGLHMG